VLQLLGVLQLLAAGGILAGNQLARWVAAAKTWPLSGR
jgi:hypothetical protein